MLWAELELLLENGPKSANHKLILKCIKDCRSDSEAPDKDDLERMNSPMSPPGSSELQKLKAKNNYLSSVSSGR